MKEKIVILTAIVREGESKRGREKVGVGGLEGRWGRGR